MRILLSSLPVDHPARVAPMEQLATLMARNVRAGGMKDPRGWRVSKWPFNALTDSWEFMEWTVEEEEVSGLV